MYKQVNSSTMNAVGSIQRLTDNTFIPFAPANTDYAAFKLAAQTGKNADGTPFALQDATGAAMTAAQIAAFVATLP